MKKHEIGLFLWREIRKRFGYLSFKDSFPTQISSQNLTRLPQPNWTFTDCRNIGYIEEMNFHGLLKVVCEAKSASQPLSCIPYLFSITLAHNDLLSLWNLHHHFPNRPLFLRTKLPMPSPPFSLGFVTSWRFPKKRDVKRYSRRSLPTESPSFSSPPG